MSDAELDKRIESKVDAMMKRVEDRVCADVKKSVPPSPAIRGWKAAGLIVSVIFAVATPALTLTWYASDQVSESGEIKEDVDRLSDDISAVRMQMSRESETTRKEIQRLREAFAAYTHIMLPMVANGRSDPEVSLPPISPIRTPVPGSLMLQVP